MAKMNEAATPYKKDLLIPSPIAFEGDKVAVENDKLRKADKWETGIVKAVTSSWVRSGKSLSIAHQYLVLLDRRDAVDGFMRLTVKKDKLKLIQAKK